VLSCGAACATVAKPASATANAIAVFFIFAPRYHPNRQLSFKL
jgi:hypothetical protein